MTYQHKIDALKKQIQNIRQNKNILSEVEIVYVTKYATLQQMQELWGCGARVFAESKQQNLEDKAAFFHDKNIVWHFIGHLQTNKVRKVVQVVHCVQSVDSWRLLEKIDLEAGKLNKKIQILLQLKNLDEKDKFGFLETEIRNNLTKFFEFENVEVTGLMMMAPHTDNEKIIRNCFRAGYKLYQDIRKEYAGFTILSMGMSADYEIAVEEGANMIRIGSKILKD